MCRVFIGILKGYRGVGSRRKNQMEHNLKNDKENWEHTASLGIVRFEAEINSVGFWDVLYHSCIRTNVHFILRTTPTFMKSLARNTIIITPAIIISPQPSIFVGTRI